MKAGRVSASSSDFAANEASLVVLIEGFGTGGQWDPMYVTLSLVVPLACFLSSSITKI